MSLLAFTMLGLRMVQGFRRELIPKLAAAEWTMLALIGFAMLSVLWAFKPSGATVPVVASFGFFWGALFISNAFYLEGDKGLECIAQRLLIALIFGVLYLGFEIATGQWLKLHLYRALEIPQPWLRPHVNFSWRNGQLMSIAASDLTRNITPLTMLLWASLLVAQRVIGTAWARKFSIVLFLVTSLVVMKSEHETSKIALIWSSLIFAIAIWWSTVWSDRLLKAAWVFCCLAVIPATLALYKLDLHNSPSLQKSLRHRIIIWNHTSEETMKSPIIGIGAGMMYQLDPGSEKLELSPGEQFSHVVPHAHNVYLQTWFELGAIGAAILTLFGLAVIERIRLLTPVAVPYAQAGLGAAMALAAASYGVWQPWFLAMFEMAFVMFAIAISLQLRGPRAIEAPDPQLQPQPAPEPSSGPPVA